MLMLRSLNDMCHYAKHRTYFRVCLHVCTAVDPEHQLVVTYVCWTVQAKRCIYRIWSSCVCLIAPLLRHQHIHTQCSDVQTSTCLLDFQSMRDSSIAVAHRIVN